MKPVVPTTWWPLWGRTPTTLNPISRASSRWQTGATAFRPYRTGRKMRFIEKLPVAVFNRYGICALLGHVSIQPLNFIQLFDQLIFIFF